MKSLVLLCFITCLLTGAGSARATESITTEGVIDAPVAAVWEAWTTRAGLASWLAPHADIDLRIHGLMRANYDPNDSLGGPGTIENEVLAYEPERMLSVRVARAPEKFPFKATISDMWTVLYLQPTSDGKTALKIVGLGFGSDPESQAMKAFFEKGNDYTLAKLQQRFRK